MARGQRNRNKMTRRQPAVLQMNFVLPAGTSYVDLALSASILNRRGYKQEDSTWGVASFEFIQPGAPAPGIVSVLKLPETWVMEGAYKKTKALWNKMNDQVLDTEPGIEGKYSDFKIAMDSDMTLQTIQDNSNPGGKILTPVSFSGAFTNADFSGAVAPIADWSYSQITVPNDPASGITSEYYLHAVGPSIATSKGIITGYERSRARPNAEEPNVPDSQGWMTNLFDVGEQLPDLRDNIEAQNDRAPYPVGEDAADPPYYPGGQNEQPELQVHSFVAFTTTTVSGKNTLAGGMFQNGLIKFDNTTGGNVTMVVHMLPGSHRGYLCEAI